MGTRLGTPRPPPGSVRGRGRGPVDTQTRGEGAHTRRGRCEGVYGGERGFVTASRGRSGAGPGVWGWGGLERAAVGPRAGWGGAERRLRAAGDGPEGTGGPGYDARSGQSAEHATSLPLGVGGGCGWFGR